MCIFLKAESKITKMIKKGSVVEGIYDISGNRVQVNTDDGAGDWHGYYGTSVRIRYTFSCSAATIFIYIPRYFIFTI